MYRSKTFQFICKAHWRSRPKSDFTFNTIYVNRWSTLYNSAFFAPIESNTDIFPFVCINSKELPPAVMVEDRQKWVIQCFTINLFCTLHRIYSTHRIDKFRVNLYFAERTVCVGVCWRYWIHTNKYRVWVVYGLFLCSQPYSLR